MAEQKTNDALMDNRSQFTPTESLLELHDRLDSLWIRYLGFLDTYITSQKTLKTQFSSGFFSLARANFSSRDGRRFGRDYYHDGAVATQRVAIYDNENGAPRLKVYRYSDKDESQLKEGGALSVHLPSSAATPDPTPQAVDGELDETAAPPNAEPNDSSESDSDTGAKDRSDERPQRPALESDPIRWFGVLVPRDLREAHSAFSRAFDEVVADAVNGARRMRETEVEIRRLRKDIRKAERDLGR